MYGPWVRIPEGSQKESEKQSESDDFLLSFYFILFLFTFGATAWSLSVIFYSKSDDFLLAFYFVEVRVLINAKGFQLKEVGVRQGASKQKTVCNH